jgi:hypothetical protein
MSPGHHFHTQFLVAGRSSKTTRSRHGLVDTLQSGYRTRQADLIAGSYQEDLPEQYPTRCPKMSTVVELKKLENADPFCDPGDPFSVPPGFLFECSEQVPVENRGQIASYAAALSGSQFRVHLFSVSLRGKTSQSACTSQDVPVSLSLSCYHTLIHARS